MSPATSSIDTLPELEVDDSDRQSSSTSLNSRCSSASSFAVRKPSCLYNIPEATEALPQQHITQRPDLAIITSPIPSNATSDPSRFAILIAQDLWKRDADATKCDIFECQTEFSIFQRRHHCRKCGGVFCAACSSNIVPLLDMSHSSLLIPPSTTQIPLIAASSKAGKLMPSRVCDECNRQLLGQRRLSTKSLSDAGVITSSPSSSTSSPRKPASSVASAPTDPTAPRPRHSSTPSRPRLTRSATGPASLVQSASPASSSGARRRRGASSRPASPAPSTQSARHAPKTDLGILESYPLKVSSQGCKSSGLAIWSPKEIPVHVAARPVYWSPLRVKHHDDDEDENAPTPIIINGDIKVRVPYEHRAQHCRREWSTF